jgi:hypothetical protein
LISALELEAVDDQPARSDLLQLQALDHSLSSAVSNPPTQTQVTAILNRLNQLINALSAVF